MRTAKRSGTFLRNRAPVPFRCPAPERQASRAKEARMTELGRRDVLEAPAAAGGTLLLPLGPDAIAEAAAQFPLHKPIGDAPTICTYCAVGCGHIVGVQHGRVVSLEGDPDHPINRGRLCSKALAARQIENLEDRRQFSAEEQRGFDANSLETPPRRLTQVLYRAPGADRWEAWAATPPRTTRSRSRG
jgi:formate dehydrogenase major subunit